MRTVKILFWVSTGILFLLEGVMTLFFFNTPESKSGIAHLGYPEYFRISLMIAKIIGAIVLIVPKLSWRLKEWAYAGFAFDFIFAVISHNAVDGVKLSSFFSLIFLTILALSYISYHKMKVHLPEH
jgi:uncharacterized membrane protein YphA (DoxX/SURF4 family)